MGRLGALVLLLGLVPVASFAAEKLGPEGFPADWTENDFKVSATSTVSASAVSGSEAVSATKPGGVLSVPIGQLPTVQADTLTAPVITTATVQVSLSTVRDEPDAPVVPAMAVEEVGKMPSDLKLVDDWGPLTAMGGGVDEKAWSQVSRSEAIGLLGGVAAKPLSSPAIQDVLSRLLLTRAAPPKDVSVTVGTWLVARAKVLDGLGLDEQAFALWRAVPHLSRNADSEMTRGWALSSLLAGQTAEPCALARKLVVQAPDVLWGEMAVVCTALDRVSGGLDLGLALSTESNTFDPLVKKLLLALRDDEAPVKIDAKEKVTPLAAAVLATYPSLLEPVALPRMPGVVLRRIVQTVALPLSLRTQAAEVLLERAPSPITAESVRVLYEAFTYPPDQVARALEMAPTLDGTAARALLWHALRQAAVPADKARAWQAFSVRAGKDGVERIPLWLGPARAGLSASSETAVIALDAARAAWIAGEDKQAKQWRVMAEAAVSSTVALVRDRAQMGLQAAAVEGKLTDAAFEQWLVAEGMGNEANRKVAVLKLAVLEGLGVTLPDGAWAKVDKMTALRDDGLGGDMVRIQALDGEAALKKTGPVLVRLAGWVQERAPHLWAPLEAKAAVKSLLAVNLKREARLLAWEIMNAPPMADPVKDMPKGKDAKKADTKKESGVKVQNMKGSEKKAAPKLLPPPKGAKP